MMIACTFPQWGGMLCGPSQKVTEEDYYMREWSAQEKEEGFAEGSVKFAGNSRSERSNKTASNPVTTDETRPTAV